MAIQNKPVLAKSLERILEESFLNYSAFVLQRRAIPDVRDGMKYTARQILHAQYKDKLDAKHPFKKSQKSVAAATSFSYVHGDASAYEQITRMGRNLVQRYFMEEFHGNNGTPCASDDYSAPRYTESRITPLCMSTFDFLAERVLEDRDWSPTYDEEGVFPLVLPSVGFYGLCNGSFGSIGVGLISSIPQFNLREMNNTICALINDENAVVDLLPDFASGGILMNPETTRRSLAKGEGKSVLLRGKIVKHPKEGFLEVVEMPYGVYTNTVCVELQKALDKGKPPFKDFKDLSKKTVQMRIYCDNCDECEKWLYKNTSVQKHFTVKLIMLRDGKLPKMFTLREAIMEHVKHAKKVYRRHFLFQLQVLKDREEVIEGFIRLRSILDEVIAAIREVDGSKAAVVVMLRSKFEFTELQATAIADRRLHQLSKFDIGKLTAELEENRNEQKELQVVLDDEQLFNSKLCAIYQQVANTYGDARRTAIAATDEFESSATGKVEKDCFAYFSETGYILAERADDDSLDGVGHLAVERTPDTDLCIVTSMGRAFARRVNELALGSGRWDECLSLKAGESVLLVMPRTELDAVSSVLFEDVNGHERTVHPSFVTCAASKRGKKVFSGTTCFRTCSVSE